MKESVTKFDFEAAFKALDEVAIPTTTGLKANRAPLTEVFSKTLKTDALVEEYYDISNTGELDDAKAAREAEIAKAKLARIEKIVDLDAESPDDLLTSYVGKYIIQCPQCMTLFYKKPEDVEESEEDPTTVNISEVCQHCGNDSGYTLIGKVGAAEEPAAEEASLEGEEATEELPDIAGEDATDESGDISTDLSDTSLEDNSADNEDIDLDIEIEDDELEPLEDDSEDTGKKEESFQNKRKSSKRLTEAGGVDLEVSAREFEQLINSPEFKKPISDAAVKTMLNSFKETKQDDTAVEEAVGQPESADDSDTLEEAGLGTFAKALGKKLAQTGKNIKDKLSNVIDKYADSAKTRDEKANWVLENALEDYSKLAINDQGDLVPEEDNRKFNLFVVVGFTDKYNSGKPITMAPSYNNNDLVLGKNSVQKKTDYKDADKIAQGWSMTPGNGPAFIYLAQGEEFDKAVFLCEYFKGKLANDQLEKYFNVVKNALKGAELAQEGGMEQTDESFNHLMDGVEELQEADLEKLISTSLVETYGNVENFKLTSCSYLNEQLQLDGIINFCSGNTRTATYVFNKAYFEGGKNFSMTGFNEKLGSDKQFTITGKKTNNTFIVESFKQTKK